MIFSSLKSFAIVTFASLICASASADIWMAGPSLGGRLIEEEGYENTSRLAAPVSLSLNYEDLFYRFEAEFAYYQVTTEEEYFRINRNHYEYNILAHFSVTGSFEGWTPRVFAGVSLFQDIVRTEVYSSTDRSRSQLELAPMLGVGYDGPVAPNLKALAELRTAYSEVYSPDFVFELNLGLLLIF